MFNETFFATTFGEISNIITNQLSLYDVAIGYILVFVIYKALGRYVFFKPREHESKINRTFLSTALVVVLLKFISIIIVDIPIKDEYVWIFLFSGLVLCLAPLSIISERTVWKYHKNGYRNLRYSNYLPIGEDYYKTSITKEEQTSSNMTKTWEEEGVMTTKANIHSDSLLNSLALLVYIFTINSWAVQSMDIHGYSSVALSSLLSITISLIYIDRAIFSWITYAEKKFRSSKQR